jgi:hypothetical protein
LLLTGRYQHEGTESESAMSAYAVGKKSQERYAVGNDKFTREGDVRTFDPAGLSLLALGTTDEPLAGDRNHPSFHQFDAGHFPVLEAFGEPRPVDLLTINVLAWPYFKAPCEEGVDFSARAMVTTPFRQAHHWARAYPEADTTSRLQARHLLRGDCIEIVDGAEDCRIAECPRPVDQGVAPCPGVAKNVDNTAISFQHEWRRGRFLPQLAKQAVSQVVGIKIPNWHLTSSGDGRDAIGAQGNLYEMDLFFSHG